MEDAVRTTIDEAGRIVVPKAIRQQAGLAPGLPILVRFQAGKVEIEPAPREVRIVTRGSLHVAVPQEPSSPLTQAEVERTLRDLREGR